MPVKLSERIGRLWPGGEEPTKEVGERRGRAFPRREEWEERDDRPRRPGRFFTVLKALVLLALMGATAYLMLERNSYEEITWYPFALGAFVTVVVTLFVRGYYEDVPVAGWALVACLAVLVGVKALSMTWSLSQAETIVEVVRSSMYVAVFLLALASLSSEKQVAPMMDIAALIVVAVAGYGIFQKIYPLDYPVSSLDGVRMDSTVGYANTAAAVIAMGFSLLLARLNASLGILFRSFSAAVLLAFLVAAYLTVSRGGIFALVLALALVLVLTVSRLQMLANLALVLLPFGWLFLRMQELPGLLGTGVPDERRVADGLAFRDDLIVALIAAFALQAVYSFFHNRYELEPFGRRVLGLGAAGLAALAALGALVFALVRYGGPGGVISALLADPTNEQNLTGRLTSLSIGFRADYWAVAWDYWLDNFLTGSGAGTFSIVWLRYRDVNTGVQQVHNLYLEQGVETGIFAFLALLTFAVGILIYVGRATFLAEDRRRMLLAGLFGALVVYLVSSAIEWHWYLPPSTVFFFILAAIAVKYGAMDEAGGLLSRPHDDALDGESTEDLEERLARSPNGPSPGR